MLERPKLFLDSKEFLVIVVALLVLLFVRLLFLYEEYETFKSKPFYYSDVIVLQAYEKWSRDEYHTILKLYSPTLDMNFFSRTKIRKKDISKKLRLKIFPNQDMKFFDYLGTPFFHAKVKEIYTQEKSHKAYLLALVDEQHQNPLIANFYKAIFFATPLEKALRDRVSTLGISHLIALSGFHLAILWGALFLTIGLLYRPFQQKYFPYRFNLYDVGFMVLVALAWYVWFVDAPASLVRSYAMMFFGWIALLFGIEILSFSFLLLTLLALLVLFPKMLLSLAFWFSLVGVFYIFLLLHYFSNLNRYLMTLLITFGIFVLMLPIVHMIFPITSLLQLSSPLLSLLFSIFYPLSILLHLVGLGGLLDEYLWRVFSWGSSESLFLVKWYLGAAYIILSLLSIYSKWLFYLLWGIAVSFSIWLFSGFWVS